MAHRTRHPSAARPRRMLLPVPATVRQIIGSDSPAASGLRHLADEVGGADALERLDDEPLVGMWIDHLCRAPGLPPVVDEVCTSLLAGLPRLSDPPAERDDLPPIDGEYSAVADRILLRLADQAPESLGRSTAARTAAAIAWLAVAGNRRPFATTAPAVTAATIWAVFGVTSCAELGRRLRDRLGTPRVAPWSEWLVEPELLMSREREDLVSERDRLLDLHHGLRTGQRSLHAPLQTGRHLWLVR